MSGSKRPQEPGSASDLEATERELAASERDLGEVEAEADAGVAKAEDLGRAAEQQRKDAERILREARSPKGPLMPAPAPESEEAPG